MFVATTVMLCGGAADVVGARSTGAGSAVVGRCLVVGTGGQLVRGAIPGWGICAIDAPSFGGASLN